MWISVKDRLPEDGEKVIVNVFTWNCVEVTTMAIACSPESINGGWFEKTIENGVLNPIDGIVTHWMPFPEPPKVGGGAEDAAD